MTSLAVLEAVEYSVAEIFLVLALEYVSQEARLVRVSVLSCLLRQQVGLVESSHEVKPNI